MAMIQPVILAGGKGTRLWPLSRGNYPKQFLSLDGNKSMLQNTILRLSGLDRKSSILICNEENRFIAAEQLSQISEKGSKIILEPIGRNTAPAIALAALKAMESGDDPLLLVLAADHVIKEPREFIDSVNAAVTLADEGKLVTFGVVPTKAETGFGYIKVGSELEIAPKTKEAFTIEKFVEKPSLDNAKKYMESGDYLWNSGMFLFKASTYLSELEKHRPQIYKKCSDAIKSQVEDLDFIRVGKEEFAGSPEDSIDYAVMENTDNGVVIAMEPKWNDVGGFSALWEVGEKDTDGNVISGDVTLKDTKNTLIYADDRLVTTVGVEDIVIINTKDALLVANKNETQKVKDIVAELAENNRTEVNFHREVYRPWGKYDSVDSGDRFQVKRITVKPGAKLSVQMHHHRAEHWIVVSGTARVTNGDKTILLTENQSTYIPVGVVHALENPGKVPLELIEVQSGSYLGEDDIVRFEDKYGRA